MESKILSLLEFADRNDSSSKFAETCCDSIDDWRKTNREKENQTHGEADFWTTVVSQRHGNIQIFVFNVFVDKNLCFLWRWCPKALWPPRLSFLPLESAAVVSKDNDYNEVKYYHRRAFKTNPMCWSLPLSCRVLCPCWPDLWMSGCCHPKKYTVHITKKQSKYTISVFTVERMNVCKVHQLTSLASLYAAVLFYII